MKDSASQSASWSDGQILRHRPCRLQRPYVPADQPFWGYQGHEKESVRDHDYGTVRPRLRGRARHAESPPGGRRNYSPSPSGRGDQPRPVPQAAWGKPCYGRITPTSPSMAMVVPNGAETCCSHSRVSCATRPVASSGRPRCAMGRLKPMSMGYNRTSFKALAS